MATTDLTSDRSAGDLRPPVWFRYGLVAATTLMLCSCQAVQTTPVASFAGRPNNVSRQRGPSPPVADFPRASQPVRQVVPVVYRQDMHQPPSAARQAEYAAGVPCAPCQVPCAGGCPCCGDDGLIGPRDEYLCDGGDHGLPAGVQGDWRIAGLEQEDTVAHYTTTDDRTIVTPSNQVCIYAPRFAAVRQVVDLQEYARYDAANGFGQTTSLALADEQERSTFAHNKLKPNIDRARDPVSLLRERQQLGELGRDERLAADIGTLASYADLQVVHTGTLVGDEKVKLARASLSAITWTGDEAPQVTIDSRNAVAAVSDRQPGVVYHLDEPHKPCLRVIKLASTGSASPGDEIEFTLRVDNLGNRAVERVTIADNLTTRLEYVPDSAKASVAAEFTTVPNEGGSEVLEWQLQQPLPAGEGCILQFKCKLR